MRLSPSIAILRTQTDDRLVELARAGSEPAFAAIVERYRRQILRATRRVLTEARAEDAAQQAFMSAWLALKRGDEVANLRSWLLMIARNTALNALRVQGYDYAELQDSLRASEAPQDELERRDVMRQTLAGLAALPERQREALLRSAVEGASHAAIARDMGLTEGATRQLVLRARMAMRGAATAMTPWPLVSWVSSRGAGDSEAVHRLIEVAVAGGGAGTTALLAKAGVVAVVAGGAVAGPGALVHRSGDAALPATAAAAIKQAPAKRSAKPAHAVAVAASAPVRWVSDVAGARQADASTIRSGKREDDRGQHKRSEADDENPGQSHSHERSHARESDDGPRRSTGSDRSGSSGGDGTDEPSDTQAQRDASGDEPDKSGNPAGATDDERSGSGSGSPVAPPAPVVAPASAVAVSPPAADVSATADSGARSSDASQQPSEN